MKKTGYLLLIAAELGMLLSAGAALHQILHYRAFAVLEREALELKREISAADHDPDHGRALRRYAGMAHQVPEMQLRVLQRQWALALERMARIRNAASVPALEEEMPNLYEGLNLHLSEMAEGCQRALAEPDLLRGEIEWQIRNIEACVAVMRAFIILSSEKNPKKALGDLRSATESFKSAVRAVDHLPNARFSGNIPRWNLSVMVGRDTVQQFSLGSAPEDRRLDLRKNLEAVIPEKGGYAPGAPIEKTVAK